MSEPQAPKTLDGIRIIQDPAEQARAVGVYLARLEQFKIEATAIRHAAITEVLKKYGVTSTADQCGVSVSLVKAIRNRKPLEGERSE